MKSEDTPTFIPSSFTTTSPAESFPPNHPGSSSDCTWHTLISSPKTRTSSLTCGIAVCPPRTGSLCPHRHSDAEIYHILSGTGIVTIDGKEFEVGKGDTVFIPGNAEHGVRCVDEGEEGEDEGLRWFYCFAVGSFADVRYRFPGEVGYEVEMEKKTQMTLIVQKGFWWKLKSLLGFGE